MNYLKLKQKIYEAIERNPLDRSAYEEMFAVCREYEKIDFQTAHAWNHELRNLMGTAYDGMQSEIR